uniref:Uncharacterized protein n=1 Tax=Arundo donax TaxID=35708 RepID=A0A0A9FGS2_ARUDO
MNCQYVNLFESSLTATKFFQLKFCHRLIVYQICICLVFCQYSNSSKRVLRSRSTIPPTTYLI